MILARAFYVLLLLVSSTAHALTITFDNVDTELSDVALDTLGTYEGFMWSSFFAYRDTAGFPGFNNGIVSPNNAAYSGGDIESLMLPIVGAIRSVVPFNFHRAYIGSGYYDGLVVTIEGKLRGNSLYTKSVTVDTSKAQLFQFDFTSVDEITFLGTATPSTQDPFSCGRLNCTFFTLDNLSISVVAEPSSFVFAVVGTIVLMGLRLRRRIPRKNH